MGRIKGLRDGIKKSKCAPKAEEQDGNLDYWVVKTLCNSTIGVGKA